MSIGYRFLLLLLVLWCGFLRTTATWAQTNTPGAKGATSATDQGSKEPGFSIESEMLTYTALERGSEAVVRDVAPFLREGVVILPSNSKILADLELWRAYMAAMYSFIEREADLEKQSAGPLSVPSVSEAVPLVQTLLATRETAAPVRGTIKDQAFMDSVARQLRLLGVRVLIPDIHMPYSLAAGSDQHFLFLRMLERVDEIRYRLLGVDQVHWSATRIADARLLLADIEAFTAEVFGGETGSALRSDEAKEPEHSPETRKQVQGKTVVLTPFSASHLASILSADLLAQELGIDQSGANLLPRGHWQHVLWLKTLESGGSMIKTETFLRTKTRYSGGAVETYALFNLKGELECSGTIYAYGGPLLAKDFQRSPLTTFDAVLQGGCKMLESGRSTS